MDSCPASSGCRWSATRGNCQQRVQGVKDEGRRVSLPGGGHDGAVGFLRGRAHLVASHEDRYQYEPGPGVLAAHHPDVQAHVAGHLAQGRPDVVVPGLDDHERGLQPGQVDLAELPTDRPPAAVPLAHVTGAGHTAHHGPPAELARQSGAQP